MPILCGCGAKAKSVIGPGGKEVHYIRCGGIQDSFADCLEKAAEICDSRGYDIIDSKDRTSPNVTIVDNRVYAGQRYERSLFIQCK